MRVGLIGLGTVGHGVYELLKKQNIVVVKVFKRTNTGNYPEMASSIDEVIFDDSIDTIIELIGGVDTALYIVEESLKQGKNVITANKALISKHFEYLHSLANENDAALLYEASVCAGITVLNPLSYIAKTNEVNSISGIVNGSTNYVLTKIFEEDYKLEDALQSAFELGYLETGSNDDMEGLDAARKINILSMISYHTLIEESSIYVKKLELSEELISYLKKNDMTMKYIAHSTLSDKLQIRVEPMIFSKNHSINDIQDGMNKVCFNTDLLGDISFIGPGAGRYETASSVMYDVQLLLNNTVVHNDFSNPTLEIDNSIIGDFIVEKEFGFEVIQNCTEDEAKSYSFYIRIAGDEIV